MNDVPGYIEAAVASDRRPSVDKVRDRFRKPGEVMTFFGITPGQRVAEINAGRCYHTGVLAEIVGPEGRVFAHSSEASLKRWDKNPIEERCQEAGLENLECVIGEMDAPNLPSDLDAVINIMTYHDSVWSGADRPAMNQAVFEALKPGGVYGIQDHHAQAGHGTEDCHELHRIEKQSVIDEVTAAGFELMDESGVLENPDDPCTQMIHEKGIKGRSSRFLLKFVKPS